jgi:hypothetical protein
MSISMIHAGFVVRDVRIPKVRRDVQGIVDHPTNPTDSIHSVEDLNTLIHAESYFTVDPSDVLWELPVPARLEAIPVPRVVVRHSSSGGVISHPCGHVPDTNVGTTIDTDGPTANEQTSAGSTMTDVVHVSTTFRGQYCATEVDVPADIRFDVLVEALSLISS